MSYICVQSHIVQLQITNKILEWWFFSKAIRMSLLSYTIVGIILIAKYMEFCQNLHFFFAMIRIFLISSKTT